MLVALDHWIEAEAIETMIQTFLGPLPMVGRAFNYRL